MIKIYTKHHLTLLVIFFILALFTSLTSYADVSESEKNRTVIGSHNAIVKIKVFSSLTCPHCAKFHIKVVPKIKKKYIESGKVQLIFIDFPLDQAAFNASKLLHCLDQKDKIKFLDTVYETQNKWTVGSNINDINENLKKVVKTLGISSTQFDKCLIDEAISDKILNELINAKKKYSIESTPTIIINEKKLEGSASFKNIEKKIDKII
jgi:protein-disulfide isomerase